ncbi:POK18 protein, partial [Acrocephalus arundinaceus]|nr:POK18 protein [Acrocephalus arundinaceus]
KFQRMPPWRYLGLEIGKQTIVPQKLAIKTKIKMLADVHQLCGALTRVRPWLGLTTKDLDPLFNLLKGGEELSSPRELTPEAQKALEKVAILKVQEALSLRQSHRYEPSLPFLLTILGKAPHFHGLIFQWDENLKDPLLILKWVFLHSQPSKTISTPQELMATIIQKGRIRLHVLAGCDFPCIYMPLATGEELEHLLQYNETPQFALDSYPEKISIHLPGQKLFELTFNLVPKFMQSKIPLEAVTVFKDGSGFSRKSVMTGKDPRMQKWESDVQVVEGSPQIAELAAIVRAFEKFKDQPFNLITDLAYVAGIAMKAKNAFLKEVSNQNLCKLLSKLVYYISHRKQPFHVMHVRSHTDLPRA